MSEEAKKIEEVKPEEKRPVKYTTPPEVLEKMGEIKHHSDEDFVEHDDWNPEKFEKND